MRVRGKGAKERRIPLPHEVLECLIAAMLALHGRMGLWGRQLPGWIILMTFLTLFG